MIKMSDKYKLLRKIDESFDNSFSRHPKSREIMREITLEHIKVLMENKGFFERFFDKDNLERYSCFNYYLIGEAFKHFNYDNFCAFLEDMPVVSSFMINEDFFFNQGGLNLIEAIFRSDYSNMPNIRRCFTSLLDKVSIVHANEMDCFIEILAEMTRLLKDRNSFRIEPINHDEYNSLLDTRVGEILDNKIRDMFYSRILLKGNRYFYINSKLLEVEDNVNIRRDIFSITELFNVDLFAGLNNSESEEDSFITCMDIVFDSCSYHELKSKLDSIILAGKKYEADDRDTAFKLIKGLSDDHHKMRYCDKMVIYPESDSCMNLVVKPKTISEREKRLLSRIDNSVSYDFLDNIYLESDSVEDVVKGVERNLKKEHSFSKRLFKTLFKK